MQYGVPQFTDVEDKLIGPLTLKQFLVLLATGGVVLFFYSILKLSFFFFIFAFPIVVLGIALAFGRFNGLPMLGYFPVFINYLARPKTRIFKREEFNISMSFKAEKKPETKASVTEPPTSRLQKLAYLLDQKTEEEKKLLDKQQITDIR
jgi:hypothetical protein